MQHVHIVAFSWLFAVNLRPVSYLNCLPFPNRDSDSGDLYIVFKRFHLTFPVAHLDFQVEARFNNFFANHAYASHTASRISYHVHVWFVYYVVCFFPVLLLRVGSENVAFVRISFDYVRLSSSWTRSSSLRDLRQDDHTLEITSIFACQMLALLLCLCCDTYHLFIMPPILLNQASNPPCPSKPLFGYVTALLSPSYSVVSCR